MSRYGFVLRRGISLVPLLLGIVALVMLLLDLSPGDPARLVAGPRAPQAQVDQVRHRLGLDLPVWQRYLHYVGDVLTGHLGTSFKTGRAVGAQIAEQLPVTLAITASGVLLALAMSVPLAVLAARRPDRLADHLVRGFGVLGIGLPTFWVAIMAIRLVALPTGWFPVAGFGEGAAEHARALVLPALVVALGIAAPMIRSLRSTMMELADAEFVRAARTLGFGGFGLVRRFQLRNAVPPLVTVTAAQAGYALFGTVVVEVAFGMPGMGLGLVTAAGTRDFPLVQGYTLVFAVLAVLLYLLSDIVTSIIDPRVRITA
ncbi:ABC transporter permease [Actinomadura macrotermitis]|uniref:Glutathione transport system permease protein GsiC n=1 Tax=Actinomadura macrotermitis TaxID=2585200 RepID=A0A7K0C5D1_9ACTN|nr:ABC transporter permease [Actinomadura macrotermitis]MQY08332.1 Glutathione transport system permease protein GsiC [Actinomadura macrotermitis]